jgi:cytidylate kinase
MLKSVTSTQLAEMLGFLCIDSGHYKKMIDAKATPNKLRASLGHLVEKSIEI